jgi:hypothetical protein
VGFSKVVLGCLNFVYIFRHQRGWRILGARTPISVSRINRNYIISDTVSKCLA